MAQCRRNKVLHIFLFLSPSGCCTPCSRTQRRLVPWLRTAWDDILSGIDYSPFHNSNLNQSSTLVVGSGMNNRTTNLRRVVEYHRNDANLSQMCFAFYVLQYLQIGTGPQQTLLRLFLNCTSSRIILTTNKPFAPVSRTFRQTHNFPFKIGNHKELFQKILFLTARCLNPIDGFCGRLWRDRPEYLINKELCAFGVGSPLKAKDRFLVLALSPKSRAPVEIVTANRDSPIGLQFTRITLSLNVKRCYGNYCIWISEIYTQIGITFDHQDESYSSLEDIVTIDSQIELKVRGELPEIKVLNAAAQLYRAKNGVLTWNMRMRNSNQGSIRFWMAP